MSKVTDTIDYMNHPYIVQGILKGKLITSRHKTLELAEALARILKDTGKWENVKVYQNPTNTTKE